MARLVLFPVIGRDDGGPEVFPVALGGETRGDATPIDLFVQHQNGLRVNEAHELLENCVSIAASPQRRARQDQIGKAYLIFIRQIRNRATIFEFVWSCRFVEDSEKP